MASDTQQDGGMLKLLAKAWEEGYREGVEDDGVYRDDLINERNPYKTEYTLLLPWEAAEMLRVAGSTLAEWRKHGKGPTAIQVGKNQIRYRSTDLEEWLDANEIGGQH